MVPLRLRAEQAAARLRHDDEAARPAPWRSTRTTPSTRSASSSWSATTGPDRPPAASRAGRRPRPGRPARGDRRGARGPRDEARRDGPSPAPGHVVGHQGEPQRPRARRAGHPVRADDLQGRRGEVRPVREPAGGEQLPVPDRPRGRAAGAAGRPRGGEAPMVALLAEGGQAADGGLAVDRRPAAARGLRGRRRQQPADRAGAGPQRGAGRPRSRTQGSVRPRR